MPELRQVGADLVGDDVVENGHGVGHLAQLVRGRGRRARARNTASRAQPGVGGGVYRPGRVEQVRPHSTRPLERLLPPPALDLAMVTAQQHVGDRHAPVFRGARVLGILEQPGREGLVGRRCLVDDPGQQAQDGVDDDQRRQLPAGQHVVADGHLQVDQRPDAVVDALVARTQQHQVLLARQLLGTRLVEPLTTRVEQDADGTGAPRRHQGVERRGDRLGSQHHAGAAAVRIVIDAAVAPQAPAAQVVSVDLRRTRCQGASWDALGERSREQLREERDDVDAQRHVAAGWTSVMVAEAHRRRHRDPMTPGPSAAGRRKDGRRETAGASAAGA